MGNSGMSPEARKEMIAKKAQEIYAKRGGTPGHELDDWLAAEKMVDREIQEAKPAGNRPQSIGHARR